MPLNMLGVINHSVFPLLVLDQWQKFIAKEIVDVNFATLDQILWD